MENVENSNFFFTISMISPINTCGKPVEKFIFASRESLRFLITSNFEILQTDKI